MKWDDTSYRFPKRIVSSYLLWSIPDLLLSKLWDHFVNGSFQLLLSMLVFSRGNIIILWVLVLILSLVKMTIIIRMSVRRMCCLFFLSFGLRQGLSSLPWFDFWMHFPRFVLLGSPIDCYDSESFGFFPLATFFQFLAPWFGFAVPDYDYLDISFLLAFLVFFLRDLH